MNRRLLFCVLIAAGNLACRSGDASLVGTYEAAYIESPTMAKRNQSLPEDLKQKLANRRRVLVLRGDHTATETESSRLHWEMKWSVDGNHLILQQTSPKIENNEPVAYVVSDGGKVQTHPTKQYGWRVYTRTSN